MDKPQSTRRRKARRRVMVLLVLCCAVFVLFLARLAWLQFAMADHYAQKMAEASSASYTLPQHAARGAITDRSGTVLAQDETVYDVYLRVPAPPGTNLRETVNTIAALTGGKDVETQLAAFCSAVSAGELPVTQGLDSIGAATYYRAGLVQSGAVRLAARGVRHWPDGTILPHTLGFTGPITAEQWPAARAQGLAMDATIGQNGLEAAYDDPAARAGRPAADQRRFGRCNAGNHADIHPCTRLYAGADAGRRPAKGPADCPAKPDGHPAHHQGHRSRTRGQGRSRRSGGCAHRRHFSRSQPAGF